jgi:hypothetical protein
MSQKPEFKQRLGTKRVQATAGDRPSPESQEKAGGSLESRGGSAEEVSLPSVRSGRSADSSGRSGLSADSSVRSGRSADSSVWPRSGHMIDEMQ